MCCRQVHCDSTPVTLQSIHDETGDTAADERHVDCRRLHKLHTNILE